MSLNNLTLAELQSLLMQETKKFTLAMREGSTQEEKDEIKARIDEIIKLLAEKKKANGPML